MKILSIMAIAVATFFTAAPEAINLKNDSIQIEKAADLGQGSVVIINDVVFLDSGTSTNPINTMNITDDFGSSVMFRDDFSGSTGQADVSSLHSGIYEVTVTTDSGYTFDDIIFVY